MTTLQEAAPKPPPDLRLLAAAIGSWIGALAGSRVPLVACWSIVAVGLVGAWVSGWRGGVSRRVLAVGLVVLACGVSVAAIGRESRRTGPVADLARRSGVAHVEMTLSGDPQPLPLQAHLPPSVIVSAKVRLLDAGGQRWAVNQPVLVIAPAASWGRLLPSTRVAASVDLRPPEGNDIAALIIVRTKATLIRGPTTLQRWAGRLRAGLRKASGGLPKAERGLLPGLVVGDVSEMPASVTADFRAAGLTHLTAVSGANLAVVVAAVFGLLRWTPLGIRLRALASAVVLLGFVVLARPSPSVVRAAAMGLLALAAIGLGRPRALLPALLGTVTALALFDPTLAARPGFALSVLATLALLVLAPGWVEPIRGWLPERLQGLAPAIAAPLAAQAACAPIIAAISGAVSLAAVPANLLALPAVPITTIFGLLAAIVSLVSPWLAAALCQIAGVPCRWLIAVAHTCAHLPTANLTAPSGMPGLLCVAVLTGSVVAAARRRGGRRTLALTVVILMSAALAGMADASAPTPGQVEG
ncbi:MAG: internalization-related competence protein ComEC/Rec2 [Mycobacterium sp.]|nr:internalization-related competence protein ComEC/Rec2 [Mycobacterium sp.]